MKTCRKCGVGQCEEKGACLRCAQIECRMRSDEARKKRARENRKVREQVMRDCGLVKVKGALGGTYWE